MSETPPIIGPYSQDEGTDGKLFIPQLVIDWASELVSVRLATELPFWLLTESATFKVATSESAVEIRLAHDFAELQFGRTYRDSGASVAHVGPTTESLPANRQVPLVQATDGMTHRDMRTVEVLAKRVHSDVIAALSESERRENVALQYLQTLAFAHLYYINKLIDAYRRTAKDPFAFPVSRSDVPIWYLLHDGQNTRFDLMPYASLDIYPNIRSFSSKSSRPVRLATTQAISGALTNAALPGEMQMHDAWSHFYHGRLDEAVRTLITAIEVALEDRLSRILRAKGASQKQVALRLSDTRNDFDSRLNLYCESTGRSIPGPILSMVPYINGVRLREELTRSRRRRHRIVHEAEHIDHRQDGLMVRIIETGTWVYEWLMNDHRHEIRPTDTYGLLSLWRGAGMARFGFHADESGIVVRPYEDAPREDEATTKGVVPASAFVDDIRDAQFRTAISPSTSDLDLVVAMAGEFLKFEGVLAGAVREPNSPFLTPCAFWIESAFPIPVYTVDVAGSCSEDVVNRVIAHCVSCWRKPARFTNVVLVVNHQNAISWEIRESQAVASEAALTVGKQCGISIVASSDLVRLARSIGLNKWSCAAIRTAIVCPGQQGCAPPWYSRIGSVVHFYDRPKVASIQLDPECVIRTGERVGIRLRDRFFEQRVDSIQVNRQAVEQAHGCLAGLQLTLSRCDVDIGAEVFRIEGVSAGEVDVPGIAADVGPFEGGDDPGTCDAASAKFYCPKCAEERTHLECERVKDLSGRWFAVVRCEGCECERYCCLDVGPPPFCAFALGSSRNREP